MNKYCCDDCKRVDGFCVILQSNQKVNARWTTDEQLLAVQGELYVWAVRDWDGLHSQDPEQD